MPWYGTSTGGGTTAGGINIKGSVPTKDNLPTTGSANDAYLAQDTGHLWVWNGTRYVDAGEISGPAGPRGAAGEAGTNGITPTFVDGFVSVLDPTDRPTVDIVEVGTGVYRIDFGIPAGGGSSGGAGGTPQKLAYTYTQSSPAKVWTFTHDLPFHPAGLDIEDADAPDAEWTVPSNYNAGTKTFTLTFPVPVRGSVTVS